MVSIDGERLLEGLRTLRSFGATGTGVVRQTFSDADMAARRWLQQQMESAGLEAGIDGVGNVFGRSPNRGPAVLIGSHSDTQPTGGWLDGAMGVMYGIEVARALGEDDATAAMAVDVVAWSDEESTYTSFLGSRSFVGELTAADFDAVNAAGESVAVALERVGLDSAATVELDRDRHAGYLEAHIEQGPHLEDAGHRIGVVTSIVGIRSIRLVFVGEQNHAGTTPMPRRKDAGVALFEFATRMRRRVAAVAGPTSVWTIGDATFEPGAESIIPGVARLVVQFRDESEAVLDRIEDAVRVTADEVARDESIEVTVSLARTPVPPADMAPMLRGHLRDAAESVVPGGWIDMPSAAAHDAMVLARHVPTAMLFIPSIGGISHDFAENSSDDDIVTGCRVVAEATVAILEASQR